MTVSVSCSLAADVVAENRILLTEIQLPIQDDRMCPGHWCDPVPGTLKLLDSVCCGFPAGTSDRVPSA